MEVLGRCVFLMSGVPLYAVRHSVKCYGMRYDRVTLNASPRKALRGGIQKSILTDFLENMCDSRQMLTKTSQWLQERASDTPTKGLLWITLAPEQGLTLPSEKGATSKVVALKTVQTKTVA